MICAWCKSDIEDDSFYCDQCSKEVFLCTVCGKPGKGKNCVTDGNSLYSPRQKASGGAGAEPAGPAPVISLFGVQAGKPQPVADKPSPVPSLKLINKHLDIEIDITDGAIIGRTAGDYMAVFSRFSQVSSRHLQFKWDKNEGWTVTDLGSTNGVSLSGQPDWRMAAKLVPYMPSPVKDNTFLLIANIEFQLQIAV